MTLAEAEEIFDYWRDNPPAHLMVQTIAAALGWKPRPAEGPTASGGTMPAPPPGLAVVSGGAGPDMPAPVLDIEAMRARNRARAAERSAGLGKRQATGLPHLRESR